MYRSLFSPITRPMWNPFNQLQSEVNRLFQYWGEAGPSGLDATVYPAINIWEDNDNVQVEAELPGFNLDDLEIYVTGNDQLSLKGERKLSAPEKSVQHRQERFVGTFERTLTLPVAVNADQVEARLENGILRIRLAKQEQVKPRKIAVKS